MPHPNKFAEIFIQKNTVEIIESNAQAQVIENDTRLVEIIAAGPRGLPGNDGADGADGNDGAPGATGPAGPKGDDGDSAYQVAVANGFVGNQAAWLASLIGPQGPAGADGNDGADGEDGAPGATGPQGQQGDPGADAVVNKGSVTVDFGLYGYSAKASVADVTITAATKVLVSLAAPAGGRDADELEFSGISVAAVVIDGVGFDVYATAPGGADGTFNVNYFI